MIIKVIRFLNDSNDQFGFIPNINSTSLIRFVHTVLLLSVAKKLCTLFSILTFAIFHAEAQSLRSLSLSFMNNYQFLEQRMPTCLHDWLSREKKQLCLFSTVNYLSASSLISFIKSHYAHFYQRPLPILEEE
ncbi:MAG: hypothetical protein J5506_01105 [Prevotella sp.]|nr:hypothetical protein [Prevotella sp.]